MVIIVYFELLIFAVHTFIHIYLNTLCAMMAAIFKDSKGNVGVLKYKDAWMSAG